MKLTLTPIMSVSVGWAGAFGGWFMRSVETASQVLEFFSLLFSTLATMAAFGYTAAQLWAFGKGRGWWGN